jgi:hypothetical protein
VLDELDPDGSRPPQRGVLAQDGDTP